MAKKNKFYKTAFWIVLVLVVILTVSLAKLMYDYARAESDLNESEIDEELIVIDLDDLLSSENQTIEIANETILIVEEEEEKEIEEPLYIVTMNEGDLLSFPNLEAEDPDGDEIVFYFSEPLNELGEWQTEVGDAGTYEVFITVSDGEFNVSEKVTVIVESVNQPPVIVVDELITVREGEVVELDPIVTDPDGDNVEITYSGWMNSSTKETTYGDSGEYEVIITASDGIDETEATVTVIVEHVNRPPVFVNII
ncbi:MAG: MBG domain-containing protein [Candidatus Woesearchaeota archaeon]